MDNSNQPSVITEWQSTTPEKKITNASNTAILNFQDTEFPQNNKTEHPSSDVELGELSDGTDNKTKTGDSRQCDNCIVC